MENAQTLHSRVAECNAKYATLYVAPPQAEPFVGADAEPMSDAERELHIRSCGYLMEDAMRRWCETGDFGYRGEADRWRILMEQAIKSRSAAQVARMERERGLA